MVRDKQAHVQTSQAWRACEDVPLMTRRGIDYQLLPNSPVFLESEEEAYPMYEPRQFILEEAIKRDIHIICFMN